MSIYMSVAVVLASILLHAGRGANCPDVLCGEFCYEGYSLNNDGCNTCVCNQDAANSECMSLRCYIHCEYGYTPDTHNCPTCLCGNGSEVVRPTVQGIAEVDPSCPTLYCIRPCDSGYVQDSDGCPTCQCVTNTLTDKNQNRVKNIIWQALDFLSRNRSK